VHPALWPSPLPRKTHLHCRHKRWGASYVLLFDIAAIIAMRNEGRVGIWNHEFHTGRLGGEFDPKHNMKEHPGYFLIHDRDQRRRVFIAGDGRVLEPAGAGALWKRYMEGEPVGELVMDVEGWLNVGETPGHGGDP